MTVIMKRCTVEVMEQWDRDYCKTGKEFDINKSLNSLFAKIILNCAFGIDVSEQTIPYSENGVCT